MGLFGLMGKAAMGAVKLAGKGVKIAGTAIGKEAKSVGKDLAKGIKNKTHNYIDETVADIKEDLELGEEINTTKPVKIQKKEKQKEVILIENKKAPSISYEEQIHAIKELNELLKEGIITQHEFDLKKKEILGL